MPPVLRESPARVRPVWVCRFSVIDRECGVGRDLQETTSSANLQIHCQVTQFRAWLNDKCGSVSNSFRNNGMPDRSIPSQSTTSLWRRIGLAIALTFSIATTCHAQSIAPFERLAGQWSGSGTVDLSNGTHELIRCRAAYDVLNDQRKLQLNIRCASESANFDLRSSANYSNGSISGNWSETNRGVAGTISGRAEGDRFQVVARSSSFNATLTLVTHGGRQSVTIRSHDNEAYIKGVSINLRRSG